MNNLFLNRYPYTDFHELNLSWLIQVITEVQKTLEDFVAINALKYADPIQWNITTQYEKNTIVIDPVSGVAYISVQPVPSGVALTNTDYWTVVFDLGQFVVRASKNFSINYEVDTTTSATFASNAGDWLVWGDVLYKAKTNITAGDTYVVDGNIERFTMEEIIGHIDNLSTINKSNLVSAINELLSDIQFLQSGVTWSNQHDNVNYSVAYGANAFFWWHNRLYRTTTSVNIGDTITIGTNCQLYTIEHVLTSLSNTLGTVISNVGVLANLNTTDKTNLVNAINELVSEIGDVTTITVPLSPDTVTAINKAWTRILQVEHRVDMYHKTSAKRAILVSDSYGETPSSNDNWGTRFSTITGVQSEMYAYSGAGFYTNQTNSILTRFSAETISNPDSVTDIIACLGANDIVTVATIDIPVLISEIGNFVSYCKANFPNAEIYIGMVGYLLYGYPAAGSATITKYLDVLAAYQLGASQGGAKYLSGVEYPLHYYYNISFNDGIHPTNAGVTALARAIAGAWKNGNYDYKGDGAFLKITPTVGLINNSTDEQFMGLAYIEHQITWLQGGQINWSYDGVNELSLGDGYTAIADITTPRSFYANGTYIDLHVTARAICDLDYYKYKDIPMILRFKDGKIYLRSLYINSGTFESHSFRNIFVIIPTINQLTLLN